MKTLRTLLARAVVTLSVAILGLACASRVVADEAITAQADQRQDKTYAGTITALDPDARIFTVKGVVFGKTFHAADPCRVTLENKSGASLNELHPGHKVIVHYQNAQGVLVASQIVQRDIWYTGYITALDPGQRTLVIKSRAGTRDFVATENCSVILNEDKVGTLENLKIGHSVSVACESKDGGWTAYKIEQKAESFTGTIQAIDANARTITAKSLMSEKKFNLGDGCRIVVADKPDAALRDLRIGDRVEFSYEDANGVLVANRIGRGAKTSETEGSPTAKISNQ